MTDLCKFFGQLLAQLAGFLMLPWLVARSPKAGQEVQFTHSVHQEIRVSSFGREVTQYTSSDQE